MAAAIGTLFALWQYRFGGADTVTTLLKMNEGAVYGALATIWGALLGFAITSTSIILSYGESPRMSRVTQHPSYAQLGGVLRAVNPLLALATIGALAALLLDKDSSPSPLSRDFVVVTTLFAMAALGRTIWILDNIIRIATRSSKARTGVEP